MWYILFWQINKYIHQTLSTQGAHIKFMWIPGHSGIHGNMQADKYAKYALAFNSITHIQTEYQSIKSSLRQRTVALWKHQWTDTTQTTQLRRIKPEIREWSSCNRNNRQEEKVLARMRLGQHTLHPQLYIHKQCSTNLCALSNSNHHATYHNWLPYIQQRKTTANWLLQQRRYSIRSTYDPRRRRTWFTWCIIFLPQKHQPILKTLNRYWITKWHNKISSYIHYIRHEMVDNGRNA